MNTFTPIHCTVSSVICRRRWRGAEDERGTDPGGVCVEEIQEIQECREAREGSQISGGESSLQADMSSPPMLGIEGGASNIRAVGRRDAAGVAQPGTRERKRKAEEREEQAARQPATIHVDSEEGGGYDTNRPIGYMVMCQSYSHLGGEAVTPRSIKGGEEVRKTRPVIGADRRRAPIGWKGITGIMIKNNYTLRGEEKNKEEKGAKPQKEERGDTRERELRYKGEGPRQRDAGKGPRAPPRRGHEKKMGKK